MSVKELIALSKAEDVYSTEFWFTNSGKPDYNDLGGQLVMFDFSDLLENTFDCRIMCEKEYNDTILSSVPLKNKADFTDWYGDPSAKILVVLVY